MRQFLDVHEAPFSIQRLSREGLALGRDIGEWFGPSTLCHVIQAIWPTSLATKNIQLVISADGAIPSNRLATPSLILIPTRLGINTINSSYFLGIKVPPFFHSSYFLIQSNCFQRKL
jgi:cysteine protease ATG4